VFLCKPVYEQVLQTLDNLSLIEEPRASPSEPPVPPPPTPSATKPPRFPDPQGGLFARDPPSHGSLSYCSLSSPSPLQHHHTAAGLQAPSFTQVRATFRVEELQVQLTADLTQGSQGLVCLRFQDLEGDFTKDHPQALTVQLALRSLLMEDLLEQNPESKHKHLMVSRGAPKASAFCPKEYMSQSCPSASNALYAAMPRSLPAHMEEAQNVFQLYQRHPGVNSSAPGARKAENRHRNAYPSTPPPSPTQCPASPCSSHSSASSSSPRAPPGFDDSLVHINVQLVDRQHPEFRTRYGGVGRSVDIDFNCLDVLITLQTWVVILDFFGVGSTAISHGLKAPTAAAPQPAAGHPLGMNPEFEEMEMEEEEEVEAVNTKLDLKVGAWDLIFGSVSCSIKIELLNVNVNCVIINCVRFLAFMLVLHTN